LRSGRAIQKSSQTIHVLFKLWQRLALTLGARSGHCPPTAKEASMNTADDQYFRRPGSSVGAANTEASNRWLAQTEWSDADLLAPPALQPWLSDPLIGIMALSANDARSALSAVCPQQSRRSAALRRIDRLATFARLRRTIRQVAGRFSKR
jgi:hypothetical protein